MKIAIVDYGAGNIRSVERGLAFVGTPGKMTGDPGEIETADAIVLPGVGAFEACMRQVAPLQKVLTERIEAGVPFLGICLGMQMLYQESEEGGLIKGLGIVPGRVTRFNGRLKVPHMGWNSLSVQKGAPAARGHTGRLICILRPLIPCRSQRQHGRSHRIWRRVHGHSGQRCRQRRRDPVPPGKERHCRAQNA